MEFDRAAASAETPGPGMEDPGAAPAKGAADSCGAIEFAGGICLSGGVLWPLFELEGTGELSLAVDA